MARVLTRGGIVVMAEPGAGHAQTGESLGVVEATGVLENEIVLQDLDAMARRAGFEEPALVSGLSLIAAREMPVSKLGSADESGALLEQWNALHNGRRRYIVLHKGPWVPTTRHPESLDARIEIAGATAPLASAAGETLRMRVRVVNRGDTRWLSTAVERRGWTRLGVHLYRDQGEVAGGEAWTSTGSAFRSRGTSIRARKRPSTWSCRSSSLAPIASSSISWPSRCAGLPSGARRRSRCLSCRGLLMQA